MSHTSTIIVYNWYFSRTMTGNYPSGEIIIVFLHRERFDKMPVIQFIVDCVSIGGLMSNPFSVYIKLINDDAPLNEFY